MVAAAGAASAPPATETGRSSSFMHREHTPLDFGSDPASLRSTDRASGGRRSADPRHAGPRSRASKRVRAGRARVLRRAAGTTGSALAVLALALTAAGPAGAAVADTQTGPPPVTILTNSDARGGDFFISPFGNLST